VAYFNVNRQHTRRMCVWRVAGCARLAEEGRCGHVHDGSGRGLGDGGDGADGAVTEFHIVGGLHPDLPFEYFMDLCGGEGALSEGAHQGVHDGGGGVSGEAGEDDDRGDAAADEGCGSGFDAGGWGGDFRG